jgi:D-cysteine desulfhydrase
VERVQWLLGTGAEVWVKRDDQTSPIYGGGKVRKLEWILANPPYDDDRPMLSVGGVGSHHLVALALFGGELGKRLHALTFTQELTPHVCANLALLASMGTEFWHVGSRAALPWAWGRYYGWGRPKCLGRWLAAGASTGLGCFGFVEAGLELAQQIEVGVLPPPRTIYLAAGTGGTAAGLAVGLALAGVATRLRLVATVERWAFNRTMFRAKLRAVYRTLNEYGLEEGRGSVDDLLKRTSVEWSIDHRWVGAGYGRVTDAAVVGLREAAEFGLRLETTYTAKCLAALRADASSDVAIARGPVLFWNTHGANDLRARIRPSLLEHVPAALREQVRSSLSAP